MRPALWALIAIQPLFAAGDQVCEFGPDGGCVGLLLGVRVHPEALYRKLLELNFLSTRSCSFAIDSQRELVYLRAMRPLDGLDYDEFVDLLKTAAAVASKLRAQAPDPHA